MIYIIPAVRYDMRYIVPVEPLICPRIIGYIIYIYIFIYNIYIYIYIYIQEKKVNAITPHLLKIGAVGGILTRM